MDNRKELLSEILKRVQRNYRRIVEIERLTKELGEAFSRNDHDSAQLLLKIQTLVFDVDEEKRHDVEAWLRGEESGDLQEFEAAKIWELSSQIKQTVKRTMTLDKAISSRMAGDNSYYHSLS